MSSYIKEYEKWQAFKELEDQFKSELLEISQNQKQIEERFYAPLEFGTAGLRGIMGAGIARMNIYTVRQATQGLASLISKMGKKECDMGVAICFDCRINSDLFARAAAEVLAANGIKVYLFSDMRPTPELSFVVRDKKCIAGINVTASHNPKEYNGYKVYWEDGAQLPPEKAEVVAEYISKTDIFEGAKTMPFEKALKEGIITMLSDETDEKFMSKVLEMSCNRQAVLDVCESFSVVYTPFHGAGRLIVPEVLKRLGMKKVYCVSEQMVPDGSFKTVKSPNPEDKEGFELAIELAKQNGVDLIIGTDPDADRVGIVLKNKEGEYITLSGNQVGVLLLDYIIKAKTETNTMPKKPCAIKTIVTTEMARVIGEKNGVRVEDSFTGFKFIAEKINNLQDNEGYTYLLGYEESYGYCVGDYSRDKDAVVASMLIAEMAAWYYKKGMTLYDAMEELYKTYGSFFEETINISMQGLDGLQRMKKLMNDLRENPLKQIANVEVLAHRDYLKGERCDFKTGKTEKMSLSNSNVLYYELKDGTSFIIRPSGTEPKVKVYILTSGNDKNECIQKIEKYKTASKEIVK